MKDRRKFFTLKRLTMLGIFIGIVISVFWLIVRSQMVKALSSGIEMVEKQGYQIGHGGIIITGFPHSIHLSSDDISVAAPPGQNRDVSKNWVLKLDQANIKSANFNPLKWQFTHKGSARVDMHGLGGARYMFEINPAQLNANLAVTMIGGLKTARFDINNGQINALVGTPPVLLAFETIQGDFSANNMEGHLNVLGTNLTISDIHLGPLRQVLGPNLSQFKLSATLKNWPLLEQQGAQYWQENQGRIVSDMLELKWGQLDLVGDFDIGFKNGKPDGFIHLYIKDLSGLFEGLTRSNLMNSALNAQARLLLSGLKTNDEGRQEIELVLRNGQLKYGFIPLYTF
ncbi:MAG: DUF2125 domain-containing protein [Robiginitomaculum sp.]|nr:DUF2125 domain-containing protein [Robiginitomaculum sp.]